MLVSLIPWQTLNREAVQWHQSYSGAPKRGQQRRGAHRGCCCLGAVPTLSTSCPSASSSTPRACWCSGVSPKVPLTLLTHLQLFGVLPPDLFGPEHARLGLLHNVLQVIPDDVSLLHSTEAHQSVPRAERYHCGHRGGEGIGLPHSVLCFLQELCHQVRRSLADGQGASDSG